MSYIDVIIIYNIPTSLALYHFHWLAKSWCLSKSFVIELIRSVEAPITSEQGVHLHIIITELFSVFRMQLSQRCQYLRQVNLFIYIFMIESWTASASGFEAAILQHPFTPGPTPPTRTYMTGWILGHCVCWSATNWDSSSKFAKKYRLIYKMSSC
jgi:hypothetical protein